MVPCIINIPDSGKELNCSLFPRATNRILKVGKYMEQLKFGTKKNQRNDSNCEMLKAESDIDFAVSTLYINISWSEIYP